MRKYTTNNKAREMARRVRQAEKIADKRVDTSDIPEMSPEFFETAKLKESQS